MRYLLLLLAGCEMFQEPPAAYGTDTSSSGEEGSTDTTPGSTDDTDDTDESTDPADTGEAFDCAQAAEPDTIIGGCVSGELTCGETRLGTTLGGTSVLDAEAYSAWYCTVFPEGDYDGSERIYDFTHPGTGTVTFSLSSPCAELDLIALRWEYWSSEDICPTAAHAVLECEIDETTGGGEVSVWANQESHYLIVVDGPEPVEDIFELSVTCP